MPLKRIATLLIASATLASAEVTPGELLIAEMNCVACHEPSAATAARLASRPSPRLGSNGVNARAEWLRAFLADPQKTKPGTLMPDMLATLPLEERETAADALVHFIVSIQRPAAATQPVDDVVKSAAGSRLYHEVGCVQCHQPFIAPAGRESELAELAARSVPLGGPEIARKYSVHELAHFLADPLKSRPGGRMPSQNLSAEEAESIAMFLLKERPISQNEQPFSVDPAKAAAGAGYFASLQCVNCHIDTPLPQTAAKAPAAKRFDMLRARNASGCIAPNPKGNTARFELTERQKTVILAALRSQEILEIPLTPDQQIRRTMTALNCYACHSRDRRGGISELRLEYLMDRQKTPPSLSGIGGRLAQDDIRAILGGGRKGTPANPIRMPVFGTANTGHLPALFEQADAPKK